MTKETFTNVIERLERSKHRGREMYRLGIDTMQYTEDYDLVIDALLTECFNQEQLEWINWYLWERESLTKPGKYNKAWKKVGGKKIEICHNIDSLYETVMESVAKV
jgi:hypothetical protein